MGRPGRGAITGLRLDEFEIPGPGGPISTWLASPPDAGDAALPLIVHFHGGPTGSFGPGSSLDAMLLTSAGYRVAMPNLRGSAGFGYDWADALSGRWGEVDAEDALVVVDWLVERGLADERRLGLYGLSYGGYLDPVADRSHRSLRRGGGRERRRQPGL